MIFLNYSVLCGGPDEEFHFLNAVKWCCSVIVKCKADPRSVCKGCSLSVSGLRLSGWPFETLQSFVSWDCARTGQVASPRGFFYVLFMKMNVFP